MPGTEASRCGEAVHEGSILLELRPTSTATNGAVMEWSRLVSSVSQVTFLMALLIMFYEDGLTETI